MTNQISRPGRETADPLLDPSLPDGAILVPLRHDVLTRVFTIQRIRLLQHLRDHGTVGSLDELAKALGRHASHVSVDVRYLTGLGLVATRRRGHAKEIAATGRPIVIQ